MLVVAWTVLFFIMLFLLGSAVGSFLNVCIVRLPQGRSLIRPPSCCGHCHTPIRPRDNIPLLSYWLLRGRCRVCGAPFSMRYFWIELLTGFIFALLYWLEIGRNIHHFHLLRWHEGDYEYLLMSIFWPRPWLIFAVHALLACFLIVATMTNHEHHQVPRSVTVWGILLGLLASLVFPWPWPDTVSDFRLSAMRSAGQTAIEDRPSIVVWQGDVTLREGLYPWPVWAPLPNGLPPDSWRLGLATGVAGMLAGTVLMVLARLSFNWGIGRAAIGWSETSLLAIAGGFLGWQPIVVAGLLGLVPGLIATVWHGAMGKRRHLSFCVWLALAVAMVWLDWHWIGPSLQGLFFSVPRLLLFAVVCAASLPVCAACLRLLVVAPSTDKA